MSSIWFRSDPIAAMAGSPLEVYKGEEWSGRANGLSVAGQRLPSLVNVTALFSNLLLTKLKLVCSLTAAEIGYPLPPRGYLLFSMV